MEEVKIVLPYDRNRDGFIGLLRIICRAVIWKK